MRKATAISTGLHAAVLLWATLSFSGKTFEVTPAESLPVDMISEKDFSQLTKGAKDAPKLDMPKPLAEKKAEEPPKPVEDSKPKVTEKKELQVAKEVSPPPDPPPPKPDPIAEKIKQKDEPKQETKVDQPLPPKNAAAKAAAEIRRRQDRGTARQARSDTQCGDRHGTQHRGFAWRACRHGRPTVAV